MNPLPPPRWLNWLIEFILDRRVQVIAMVLLVIAVSIALPMIIGKYL